MAVAKSNSRQLSTHPCNCYKVSTLIDTILDSDQIAHLENRYRLGEQLGWGQFGIIRACLDKLTGEILACKSIAKERLVTLDDLQSVKLEIEIMTRLSGHPNVVDLKAVYEDEDYVHLVMELCAGGELFHRLEKNGRYSESEAKVLFRDLMQVVVYCHDNGVVHRDLKPENILMATKASSSPIKLADFGLATYIKPGQSLHGTVGSPFYIAPEVLAGGYNQAADVWSAGVILYILLSGMPPFWGKTKSKIFDAVRASDLRFPSDPWDHLSESSKDLITKMLCTDPAQRLTASEVLDHSWMEDCVQLADDSCKHEEGLICAHKGLGNVSFSTTFICRNQDISFGAESPIDAQPGHSPTFTCRSSFSSFLVDAPTPCSASRGFSFSSCGESNNLEFSSPIPSMPSFAFSGPCSLEEQANPLNFTVVDDSAAFVVQREGSLGKLFVPADLTICLQGEEGETERKSVVIRKVGATTASRAMGIRSRRNHTIGLGELEQLDLMVTESVIRWASCTIVSSAPSLRSSLVC